MKSRRGKDVVHTNSSPFFPLVFFLYFNLKPYDWVLHGVTVLFVCIVNSSLYAEIYIFFSFLLYLVWYITFFSFFFFFFFSGNPDAVMDACE